MEAPLNHTHRVELEVKEEDPYAYMDDDGPKKYPAENARRYPEEEMKAIRDELFENGSEFRFTERHEVVGIDNVLEEIDQLIHWLAFSKDYQQYNARLEPGVIFEGDPGTGKTLVSRYIASASNALFVNIRDFAHNGSLFRDADIADLFKRARAKYDETGRPIVMFWDEFENGACERSNATPEQAATVSQLTAELDGIHGKNEGILLIGCTNYIYGIDQALRRSGRMGLQIEFHAPDRAGKKLLLDHYVSQYETTGPIDIETLSYFFNSGDTAADIEESCMEAWRHAVRRTVKAGHTAYETGEEIVIDSPSLNQEDLIEVFLKRLVGPPTAFINMPLEDRARVAVHEVGHAIMALVYDIPLRLITVQPGKKSLGRTIVAEPKEHIGTHDELISDMRISIGSIVCERQAGLPASVGATGDVDTLCRTAVRLVDDLSGGQNTKLFKPGAVSKARMDGGRGGGPMPNISEAAVSNSDRDIEALIEQTNADGAHVMAAIGKENIWKISNAVNDKVTLTGREFEELFMDLVGAHPRVFRA
jgi:cell division protease FtsH